MPCSFSYSGTSPATTVAFTRNPQIGDWTRTRKWMSPMIEAAGGEDLFVNDKSIVREIHSLHWARLPLADWTSLLAFLTVVDGAAETFDYVDPAGVSHTARIWNSQEIRSSPVWYKTYDVTIELIVTPA